ncbi:MAG TPA: type II toxin-antitoxin system ParD family antitoxin [Pirellulaceae bacterium]|jgi:antitoxin ParD1/3/4
MSITVSAEVNSLVQQELASGQYASANELLLAAVQLLHERNKKLVELREAIQPALDRLDRGEGKPLDMEAIKAEARRGFENSASQGEG